MTTILFEQPYRGNVWRLELSEYNGSTFANWRRWFWKDGKLLPSRDGCTFPVERLPELLEALTAAVEPGGGSDGNQDT